MFDMHENLYEWLQKNLTKEQMIVLMWESLDEMQSYNGQTQTTAIMKAVGAKQLDEKHWGLPDKASIEAALGC